MFLKRLVKASTSFFYIGYLPAPGTFASAAGIGLVWVLGGYLFWGVALVSVIGFCLCGPAVRAFEHKDPAPFVLDEVAGMMLSVLWLPRDFVVIPVGFCLFRFLDILKPWPLNRIQRSENPSAIMADDLAAGVLTNLFLQVLTRLL